MSATPDSTLANPEQRIADLERQLAEREAELAERTAERDQGLQRETATAEVLRLINSSPGDLTPVFDTILEKAHALCGATLGALFSRDGENFRAVAAHSLPEPFAEQLRAARRTSNSLSQPLLAGARFVHVPDLAEIDEPMARAGVALAGVGTILTMPLRKDDVLLGWIAAARQEVRPFTEKQIALLQNFAAQAVIAMENARLITETHEALEQQTATAEVLQVINSSPGDLASVFDAILEKAMQLCAVTRGHVFSYDGELFRGVAGKGDPKFIEGFLSRLGRSFPPAQGITHLRIVGGARLVHLADIRQDEVYLAKPPDYRADVDSGGIRSLLTIALRKDETLLGAITVYRDEVRPFSDREVSLLENFAAQAVIAMENARLLGELRERTSDLQESLEYQTAISDVLKVISASTFDLQPVLDTVVETAVRLCEAEFGNLFRRDGERYRRASSFGSTTEYREVLAKRDDPLAVTRGSIVGRVVLEAGIVHVHDVAADPEYKQPQTVHLQKLRSSLGVPLLRDGEPIGVLTLGRHRVAPFTEPQIELVRTFADQAVIAIENARLFNELQARTEEVAAWNRQLEDRVAEQVEELGRVGRLKRFLAPQLAELIVSHGDEKILESHRRDIVVVFCDLRGYTAFTETAEPEEVLDFLREYHGALGPLVSQFEGTLDQFSGDGIMVFFNDPVPCPDPAERAVKMAMAMREEAGKLIAAWRRRRGRLLGFGAGIAQGYATLGQIGFAERSGYTAIGTVCNLAARLCAEAKDGQILVAQPVAVAVEETTPLEEVGELTLKGLTQPVVAYNVPLAATQPALRVIEGGPQSV